MAEYEICIMCCVVMCVKYTHIVKAVHVTDDVLGMYNTEGAFSAQW